MVFPDILEASIVKVGIVSNFQVFVVLKCTSNIRFLVWQKKLNIYFAPRRSTPTKAQNRQTPNHGLTATPFGLCLPPVNPLAYPVHDRLVQEHVHRRQQHLASAPESLEGGNHVPFEHEHRGRRIGVEVAHDGGGVMCCMP